MAKYQTSKQQFKKLFKEYRRSVDRRRKENRNKIFREKLSYSEFKQLYTELKGYGTKKIIKEIRTQEQIVTASDAKKILSALGETQSKENIQAITSGERWKEYKNHFVSQDWGKGHMTHYEYTRTTLQAFYAWIADLGIDVTDSEGYI